uniref:Uncharacterized protein n=1 Tax=Laurenciella marilzae TaxID=1413812 RepID=A0A1Z1M1V8_9FLOR|nr:hypothetical protein [Laurenciella marilzae]ARW59763.1 hypothetical protein [Laurenciella marilzae]
MYIKLALVVTICSYNRINTIYNYVYRLSLNINLSLYRYQRIVVLFIKMIIFINIFVMFALF